MALSVVHDHSIVGHSLRGGAIGSWIGRRLGNVQAGGRGGVVMPLADQVWGERYGKLRDPSGHLWSVGSPLPQP